MHGRTFLQRTRQCARQRDLQTIQNPGDAERNHDAGVEAAPAQTVETRRNAGFDDAIFVRGYRPRRANRRKNRRIAQAGHAALLQYLPLTNSTEIEAQWFNADLRCTRGKSMTLNR